MFKIFEPNKIFQFTSRAPKYVLFLFVVVLSVGLVEALVLSPEDYKQSDAVRIMYVHVPSAWISLGIFTSITFLSICGFIFKNKNFFLISKSSIHSSMLYPLLIMTAAFALFSLLIFLMKYNTELIKIKNKGLDRL